MGAYSKQGSNNKIGKIFIKESTGNIEIAEGYIKNSSGFSLIYKNKKTFSITYNLTNCHTDSPPTNIIEGESLTITFSADAGYSFAIGPSVANVTGATNVWDYSSGTLTISNPTDNVIITLSADKEPIIYTVSFSSDYDFSIDGGEIGTYYETTYEYDDSDPTANNLYYGISMDGGIDGATVSGTYESSNLTGNVGDTYRELSIYGVDGDIYITITGVI